jgi:hypothetical protein
MNKSLQIEVSYPHTVLFKYFSYNWHYKNFSQYNFHYFTIFLFQAAMSSLSITCLLNIFFKLKYFTVSFSFLIKKDRFLKIEKRSG